MSKSLNLKPVLVLDGERESALAIVRSLGRRRLDVEVGSRRGNPIAALSKYCSGHFIYPDPLKDLPGYQKALLEQLEQRSYSLIIPVTDLTICPLMEIRESVEALSPLAMASSEALSVAMSKSYTYAVARELGVPIPRTLVIRDAEEFDSFKAKQNFPAVIKADRSKIWSSNGKGYETSVRYALNSKELKERVSRLLPLGPVVLQEYVRGNGVGMGVLASRGETIFAFQYRRLHEVPLRGGASSYRVSEAIDPELLAYASSLLKHLGWDGVAMVEFKKDRETGKTYLMEINGRFWGSLPLAVAAEADFPFYLFDLIVHQRRKFPAAYKVGLRCRQLSGEVEWLKEVLFRRRDANVVVRYPSYQRILADSCRFFNPAEHSDALDLRDPRPGIADLHRTIRQTAKDAWNKLLYLRQKRRMSRFRHNPKSLVRKLRRARTILIICHGNIIRSPFAAHFLVQSVMNKKSVSIHSAGLEAVPGLRAHPSAVSRAKSLGFDLSAHVSVLLTEDMVGRADLIFVMEIAHLLLMRKRFSGVWRKTFLLACLHQEVSLEISDPVYKDETIFDMCFEQIIRSVKPIALILTEGNLLRRVSV